ncbi:hypothetical protein [Bacillus toyonensis]|uniref:hypothetical protein n=1 Tax=Bacillus toyonensis TaxID=155322 RepID=UPI000BF8E0B4|nr:hypothetical protein [Bacillus toyonensis]PGF00876.1 hypothetical protein COM61_22740 [Bacillus toyonensis]PHE46968.1 hypothetical protein COF71_13490 [Bacillus toyonensis]
MIAYVERKGADSRDNPASYLSLHEDQLWSIGTGHFQSTWSIEVDDLEELLKEIRSHEKEVSWEQSAWERMVKITIG